MSKRKIALHKPKNRSDSVPGHGVITQKEGDRFASLITLTVIGVSLAQIYALLGRYWWGFELFTHYAAYIFAGALLASAAIILKILIILKNKRAAKNSDNIFNTSQRGYFLLLPPLFAVIAIQTLNFLPYFISNYNLATCNGLEIIKEIISSRFSEENDENLPAKQSTQTLKILSSNFLVKNFDFETIKKVIAAEKPDIVQIVEADYAWREQKKMFEADYPYVTISEKPGAVGYVFASKFPANFYPFELAGYQSLETELNINGSPLRIFTVHTFPPSRADLAEIRNRQFEELAANVGRSALSWPVSAYDLSADGSAGEDSGPTSNNQESNIPTIAIGDFNSAPWSPFFKDMLTQTGLRDAALGCGLVNTWNADLPFLRIPIDHALVSSEISVTDFHRTSYIGSDHYPIVVTLQIP